MRYKLLILRVVYFFVIFPYLLLAGTTGKIAGLVSDANLDIALPGVNVYIENTPLGAATDLDGYFVILNVPPGNYNLKATMVGYTSASIIDVRVNIDQTTEINFKLSEETLEIKDAIVIIAERPVVERDVAASRANINIKEVEVMPVVNVNSVIGLQAGVRGLSIRDGGLDEVAFMVNGITLRDERDNQPYTGISYTSIEEIQVQAGGFSAEFGNIRSGLVNVVTKEGKRDKYDFGFIGRYRSAAVKHFGQSPNSKESYWIKPFIDPEVCWDGTKNWDPYFRKQYPEFMGFDALSEKLLSDSDPNNDLTPLELQRLFLWEHRRKLDINGPDYSYDFSFGGPVPYMSKKLGNLRFHTSYRSSQSMYIIPVSDDAYRDYNWQVKITSDIDATKKLMIEGLIGKERGTADNNSGGPGIFKSSWEIPSYIAGGFSYADGAMFGTDYWALSRVEYASIGIKFTHALSPKAYYEVLLNRFSSKYNTNPGEQRDRRKIYQFGANYYTDEAPYGFEPTSPPASIITGMNMGTAFATSRDSSKVASYTAKFDLSSQLDRYNFIKSGLEFTVTRSQINYARYDADLKSANQQTKWDRTPVRGAFYVYDKLEFESMVAQLGLRVDYSHAGGKWYVYDPYNKAFSGAYSGGLDTLLKKEPTKHIFTLSPRLNISFPITEDSKLYFNYGHFSQLPGPENLYILRKSAYYQTVSWIANPNSPLPKTIAYELGYEHNISDQFLLRLAGYYKDTSQQPLLVSYISSDASVNYSISEPNSYKDTRGFEITINKNRGSWIRGFLNYTYMVSTSGRFGYGSYYESSARQREYLLSTGKTYHYQAKPVPRPYARANINIFSPLDYGPEFLGFKPLADWNIDLLSSWDAGVWERWYGGLSTIVLDYNIQWRDNWYFDIRLTKTLQMLGLNFEFFVDINNVFNIKRLTSYGFSSGEDRTDYFKSLHFPADIKGNEYWDYVNIPGNDRPGDYRKPGVSFIPIVAVHSRTDVQLPITGYLYYESNTKQYLRYTSSGTWVQEDAGRVKKLLDDKAYIDMPNFQYFTFLDPRSIFWGLKITFEL